MRHVESRALYRSGGGEGSPGIDLVIDLLVGSVLESIPRWRHPRGAQQTRRIGDRRALGYDARRGGL